MNDFIQNLDEAIEELSSIENPSEDVLASLARIREVKAQALAAFQNPQPQYEASHLGE